MHNYWQILINFQHIINVVLLLKNQSNIYYKSDFNPLFLCLNNLLLVSQIQNVKFKKYDIVNISNICYPKITSETNL